MTIKTLMLQSLAETRSLGVFIGEILVPGDTLLLTGDLGAGKTTLTQSIARGFGVPEKYYINSPSFALLHEYPGRSALYHFDFYRLHDEDDIEDAGLSEYLETRTGVCVIEWASRLGRLTPDDALHIQLTTLQNKTRQISFESHDAHWSQRLVKLGDTFTDLP